MISYWKRAYEKSQKLDEKIHLKSNILGHG